MNKSFIDGDNSISVSYPDGYEELNEDDIFQLITIDEVAAFTFSVSLYFPGTNS